MKGWKYRMPRCRVCGKEATAGTQSRPLCISCQIKEKENHIDHCCTCGCILKNVPDELKGCDDLLCVDCMNKEKERIQ